MPLISNKAIAAGEICLPKSNLVGMEASRADCCLSNPPSHKLLRY